MKKTLLTLLFAAILSTLSFAQTVQKTYYFGTPMVSEVNGYDVVRFADTYNTGITGEAALPWQTVSLLLPQNTDAQRITVDYGDFVELEGSYNLLPQQAARPLSSTAPFVFEKNEDFYRSDNVYPEITFSKVKTQYLNGCSFAFAQFTPVRYIPSTGKVSYAKSVTVTIDVTASKSDRSNKLWMTPEVQARVERLAQNPEAVAAYKNRARTIGGYELLVITPEEWVPYFDEYVAFYEARGLRTRVTALETILADGQGRDDAESVRDYISQEYENEGIMMVLLGGDSGLVPWRALYCDAGSEQDNLPADMYFVCLDGTWDDDNNGIWGEIGEDDLLPELAIGRMPFNNEVQFNNMMHKTLEYQANPVLGEFQTVVLGAEHLGEGYYGREDLERLIGGSSDYDYTTVGIPEEYDFVKYYESPIMVWSGAGFRNEINQNGGQYVHHVGHANTDYVAGWYVNGTNDNSFAQLDGVQHNYGFFHSHGCICGDFSHTCILERMVNISTGFVATTGNSRYGWYVPWGDGMAAHLHREFVDAYYNDRLPYIGTAFVEMKIMTAPYVTEGWGGENGALRWNIYDINILGDVAVCPWLDEPFRPQVSYASALALGTTTVPVTVAKDGVPQSNFRCSIFHNEDLLAFGMTDENGNANINFAQALDVADSLTLIITGPNAWPQSFPIIGLNDNTAFVYPENNDIHGDFVFGSNISMDVDFRNAGSVAASNVTASLTTLSEYVNLTKSTVEVGTINAGDMVSVQNAFTYNVADDIPNGTYVDFVMTCSDGNNVWNRNIYFMAKAPVLRIDNASYYEINGDMNGFIDAGETVRIEVYGKNKGFYVAANTTIHGTADSQYVTFVNNDVNIGNLNIGDDFYNNLDITIGNDAPEGTVIHVNLEVISGSYMANKEVVIVVGTVKEDFETGDFSHLVWNQNGSYEWVVTDEEAHSGTHCAQVGGNIPANQTVSLSIEIENLLDGFLSFYIKTASKNKVDGVALFVDDEFVNYWSGNKDWMFVDYALSTGYHKIEWQYVTDEYGHQDASTCWIDDITFPGGTIIMNDVDEVVSAEKLLVYPNPANNVVYLKGADIQYVEIYNVVGTKILSQNMTDSESINIASFESGIYFVRVFDNKGIVSTTKFIKE
jgi:hypothetical protein